MSVTQVTRPQRKKSRPASQGVVRPAILPLQQGDHLSRDEFERRYNAMPGLKKAELIEGRVYMPSPVTLSHGRTHADIMTWLGTYRAMTPGVTLVDNGSVHMDDENEPQPDALLRIESEELGHSRISSDDYIEGAPELIVEIAASSASYDLHEKLELYRRNGVKEYLIWQIYESRLDWFELREGRYVVLEPDPQGILLSRVFPGLRLAPDALLSGDLVTVLSELQSGLQSEQHAAFVRYLAG